MSATPREIQGFQFKQLCQLRVFGSDELPVNKSTKLVAAACKYGLVFVGCPNGLKVILLKTIIESREGLKRSRSELSDYSRRHVPLPAQPTHLDVSCDHSLLAIGLTLDQCPVIIVYSVTSFASQNVTKLCEVRASTVPSTHLLELAWNPGIPLMLATCISDGSAVVYTFNGSAVNINSLPADARATCMCWSPKGKQIVIGSSSGSLTQYKPELTAVRTFPPPRQCTGPTALISVQWLSNFQFAATYADLPGVTIMNAPRTGEVTSHNFEYLCLSSGTLRPEQFYFVHQQAWNVLLVGSANAIEVGVLGLLSDQSSWEQWLQEDGDRAELPLTAQRQETFPVGIAFDTSPQNNLPWGENQSLPPMPALHVLSNTGVLCIYFVVNTLPNAATICAPPQPLPDLSGAHLFTSQPAVPAQQIHVKAELPSPVVNTTPAHIQSPAASAPSYVGNGLVKTDSAQAPVGSSLFGAAATQAPLPFTFVSHDNSTSPAVLIDSTSATLSLAGLNTNSGFSAASTATTTFPAQPTKNIFSTPTTPIKPFSTKPAVSVHAVSSVAASQSVKEVAVVEARQPDPPRDLGLDAAAEAANNTAIRAAMEAEIKLFEKEMSDLKASVNKINIHVGTEEEKISLKVHEAALEVFFRELKETTAAQSTEINILKTVLLETFSWAEDARIREIQLRNPCFVQLLKSKYFDPVNARRMDNIEALKVYIDTQLDEVNKHLDNAWLDCRDKQSDSSLQLMQLPSMETVYQVMVLQKNILNRQRYVLEDISQQIALYQRKSKSRVPLITELTLNSARDKKGDLELSKLADNMLHMRLKDPMKEPFGSHLVAKQQSMLAAYTQQRISEAKINRLRNLASNHKVIYIRPPKPSNTPLDWPAAGLKFGSISSGKPVADELASLYTSPKKSPVKTKYSMSIDGRQRHDSKKVSKTLALSSFNTTLNSSNVTANVSSYQDVPSQGSVTVETEGLAFSTPNLQRDTKSSTKTRVSNNGNDSPSISISPSANKIVTGFEVAMPKTSDHIAEKSAFQFSQSTPEKAPFPSWTSTVTSSQPFQFSFTPSTKSPSLFGAPSSQEPHQNLKFSLPSSVTAAEAGPLQTAVTSVTTENKIKTSSLFGGMSSFTFTAPSGNMFGSLSSNTIPVNNTSLSSKAQTVLPVTTAEEPTNETDAPAVLTTSTSFDMKPVPFTSAFVTDSAAAVTSVATTAPETSFSFALPTETTALSGPTITSTFSFAQVVPSTVTMTSSSKPPLFTSFFGQTTLASTAGSFSFGLPVSTPASKTFSLTPDVFSVTNTSSTLAKEAVATTPSTSALEFSSGIIAALPVTTALPEDVLAPSDSTQPSPTQLTELDSEEAIAPVVLKQDSVDTNESSSSVLSLEEVTIMPIPEATESTPSEAVDIKADTITPSTEFSFQTTSTPTTVSTSSSAFSFAPTSDAPLSSSTFSFSQLSVTHVALPKTNLPFGQPSTPVAVSSIFGGQAPTTASPAISSFSFALPSSTTAPPIQNSFLGGGQSSLFGSLPTTTTASQSFFGQPICSPNTSGTSMFGQGTGSFGQTPSSSSPFGSTSAFGAKPLFGQSGGSLFGQTTSGGFGSSGNSVFSSGGNSGGSIFGASAGSGSPIMGSLFQASGGASMFGGGAANSGSGSFSGGGQSVSQAGFASPSPFNKPAGSFGSSASFGAPPSFGSSPTFGGSPTFGSPNKVFGSNSPTVGFGSPQQQSNTFETLANQSTMTFGNLAQGQAAGAFGAPSVFGSSPQPPAQQGQQSPPAFVSTTFGGSSFSSWR